MSIFVHPTDVLIDHLEGIVQVGLRDAHIGMTVVELLKVRFLFLRVHSVGEVGGQCAHATLRDTVGLNVLVVGLEVTPGELEASWIAHRVAVDR